MYTDYDVNRDYLKDFLKELKEIAKEYNSKLSQCHLYVDDYLTDESILGYDHMIEGYVSRIYEAIDSINRIKISDIEKAIDKI